MPRQWEADSLAVDNPKWTLAELSKHCDGDGEGSRVLMGASESSGFTFKHDILSFGRTYYGKLIAAAFPSATYQVVNMHD